MIGQRAQPHAASVFLRGRNGVTLEAAGALLSPFAEALERRLGVALRDGNAALLAVKTLEINVADASNWPAVSDWLRAWAQDYDASLKEIARDAADV